MKGTGSALESGQNCVLTNDKIGRLFGMTYSSVNHILRSVTLRTEQDNNLKERADHVYSLF